MENASQVVGGSDQRPPNPLPENAMLPLPSANDVKKNRFNVRLIVMLFLPVIFVGFITTFIYNYLTANKQIPPKTSPLPLAEVTSIPLNVWTTYTNKKYFYSIQIPPGFVKQNINDQVDSAEEYVEFIKSTDGNVSKIRILMTSSKTQRDEIAKLKLTLKDTKMNDETNSGLDKISKIYIANFTGYKVESDNDTYSLKILVEKDKWIYQFNMEGTNESKQLLSEVLSKIIIYDSATEFSIDGP